MTRARDLAAAVPLLLNDGVGENGFMWSETNANGTYIRFADGTQLCWGGVTSSSAAHVAWTFPAEFVAAPRIQATCLAAANARIPVYSNATATGCDVGVYSTGNVLVDNIFTSVFAVGRWF